MWYGAFGVASDSARIGPTESDPTGTVDWFEWCYKDCIEMRNETENRRHLHSQTLSYNHPPLTDNCH